MKILLIDIDSKIPNLALKKIEKYHIDRGDQVIWNNELFRNHVDKIYVSCIFTKNKKLCKEWEGIAEIGGSGYDLKKRLPFEIESVQPRINWGFTTIGCFRNCPFCIVCEKEGTLRIVGDIYTIWDGKSKYIVLMDNNILGLSDWFKKIISQIKKENLIVDFNQGLDFRLLTGEIVDLLASIKHKEYHFAFDNPKELLEVSHAIDLLKIGGIKRSTWYVLVGFNTSFEQDLLRLNFLRGRGQNAYVMRHENTPKDRKYIRIAQWANKHNWFQKSTFEEFCKWKETH